MRIIEIETIGGKQVFAEIESEDGFLTTMPKETYDVMQAEKLKGQLNV
jgi:hypothetical protein